MLYSDPFIWRFIPGQDRRPSDCVTRKMTEAERIKYGQAPEQKIEPGLENVKYLKRKKPPSNQKMTNEQLNAEIAELGTDMNACKKIAEKYGYSSWNAVRKRIVNLEKMQHVLSDDID